MTKLHQARPNDHDANPRRRRAPEDASTHVDARVAEALEDALRRVAAGEPAADAVLGSDADDLAALLRAAAVVSRIAEPPAARRALGRADLEQRLRTAAPPSGWGLASPWSFRQHPAAHAWRLRLAGAVVAVALLVTAADRATANARPGDALWPVRAAFDDGHRAAAALVEVLRAGLSRDTAVPSDEWAAPSAGGGPTADDGGRTGGFEPGGSARDVLLQGGREGVGWDGTAVRQDPSRARLAAAASATPRELAPRARASAVAAAASRRSPAVGAPIGPPDDASRPAPTATALAAQAPLGGSAMPAATHTPLPRRTTGRTPFPTSAPRPSETPSPTASPGAGEPSTPSPNTTPGPTGATTSNPPSTTSPTPTSAPRSCAGIIRGRVTALRGGAADGARVQAVDPSGAGGPVLATAIADASGAYAIAGLCAGRYTVSATWTASSAALWQGAHDADGDGVPDPVAVDPEDPAARERAGIDILVQPAPPLPTAPAPTATPGAAPTDTPTAVAAAALPPLP